MEMRREFLEDASPAAMFGYFGSEPGLTGGGAVFFSDDTAVAEQIVKSFNEVIVAVTGFK
jgi:hypothetical protein